MENKKITIPVIIILVIAVVSLGIAFATFSTVLNINGSADVAATSWDIFFTTEDDGAKPTQSTPDRKSTRLNSSHRLTSRMPSSA